MLALLFIAAGLVVLVKGADVLVGGASRLARAAGVSPLLIGLTLVAFGTSAPELAVSSIAALQGQPAVAIGNITGSNTANIGLVLGLAALLAPLRLRGTRRETVFMLFASALLLLLAATSRLGWLDGLVLLAAFAAFLWRMVRDARKQARAAAVAAARVRMAVAGHQRELGTGLLLTAAGLAAVVIGAKVFLDSSVVLARSFGISERVIGLTLIAVGTSLPELVTSVVAALRQQHGIAVGNIIGSNIFNILFILGIASVLAPLPVAPAVIGDIFVALLFAVPLLFLPRLARAHGLLLLAAYAAYAAYLFT